MKLIKIMTLFIAFLLGLCLGEFANELLTLSAGTVVAARGDSVTSKGRIAVHTFSKVVMVTINPCAATTTVSKPSKVEIRSQEFLIEAPLPTTTITRYSTLRSTITVPRIETIYIANSRASIQAISTRTTTRTSTSYTTVPAVSTGHGIFHPPNSKSELDDLDEYDYEFDDEYDLDEDETDGYAKIELRDLAAHSLASTAVCPSDIFGEYQFPHLIIPTSVGMPDEPVGDQYMVWISPAASTLFNFDIPASYTGICSLLFLFPFMSELGPSAGKYKYSGMEQVEYQNGGLNFALLAGVADNSTTYNTTPPVAVDYGKVKILPGNRYTVSTFPCPAGKTITIQGSSVNKTELDYFQNSALQPIGLYIVPCI
ncbi:ubiquitin 3 binding protein But2 C-terminal domain-containing protein [Rhexocercosporidium sp. MPI-PUGE-AT-0058]|nr:ubiquitin 3 binding protein But2 C-terminal domain-containing protein [Rhexocercosporidium sp. MPI-PUGE-AT-0058]